VLATSLLLIILHSFLIAGWMAEGDIWSLYLSLTFLGLGFTLLWLKRRANVKPLKKLNFKYGATYLGCGYSGLNMVDVLLFYAITLVIAFIVGVLYHGVDFQRISEILVVMYIILTLALCAVYPFAYHPMAENIRKISKLLEKLKSTFDIISCSYARFVGLLARLKDGVLLMVAMGPFIESSTSPILIFIEQQSLREGEEWLSSTLMIIKFLNTSKYLSLTSLVEWHITPKIAKSRTIGSGAFVFRGRDVRYTMMKGIVDLPHPELKGYRVKGPALVIAFGPEQKLAEAIERDPGLLYKMLLKVLPPVLDKLKAYSA